MIRPLLKALTLSVICTAVSYEAAAQLIVEQTDPGNVLALDTIAVHEWKGTIESLDTWAFALEEDAADAGATPGKPVAASAAPRPLPSVSVLQARLALLPEEFLVPYNDILEEQIVDYIVNHYKVLERVLGRYFAREGEMRSIFNRYGVPEDLTVLCIVESALNTNAISKAGAAGLWQLMPETAFHYGLACDPYQDDRFDPYLSTVAAAKYLRDAYRRWGNWPLAISSYNCGHGNVMKAKLKAGEEDYWSIYQYLPKETRGYMPAFLAALYTVYFYPLHGMNPVIPKQSKKRK